MLSQITPIVLTYNEEPNIFRSLSALAWANEVLVIDSFSNDRTLAICAEFSNVRFIQRKFDNSARQCNFALRQDIRTEWVLSMDADYIVTQPLIDELAVLDPPIDTHGYRINFDYLIDGKKLRGSLYPARTALYRAQSASYRQDGHTQRVAITGRLGILRAKLEHDDRKPFARWLESQKNYAKQESRKLGSTTWPNLTIQDKLRKLGIAPLIVVPYSLFVKTLILDGQAGFKYTGQRFIAELYLQLARLRGVFAKNNLS